MARKGKGRGKISKNTIEEVSTESPPKGATPPPIEFEDQDVELDVADSEPCVFFIWRQKRNGGLLKHVHVHRRM